MTLAAWILLPVFVVAWIYMVYVLIVEPLAWHYRGQAPMIARTERLLSEEAGE